MTIPAHRLSALDAYRFGSPKIISRTVFRSLFDSTRNHDYYAAGGGTASFGWGFFSIGVDGTNGAVMIHRTKRFYTGGRSMHRAWCNDAGGPNQVRRIGRFTDDDGFFFELNGTDLRAVVRVNTVDTAVDRIAWTNDRVDGTAELVSYDATKEHVYEISITPRRVEFYIDAVLCHVANITAVAGGTIVRDLVLPAAIEVRNTGASSIGVVALAECVCIEDDDIAAPPVFSWSAQITADLAPGRCVVLRPQETDLVTIPNRKVIRPRRLLATPHTWPIHVSVYRSFSAVAYSAAVFAPAGDSSVQVAEDTADLPTLGSLSPLFEATISSPQTLNIDLRDFVDPIMRRDFNAGADATAYMSEQLIIHAHTHAGGANNVHISVSWSEE